MLEVWTKPERHFSACIQASICPHQADQGKCNRFWILSFLAVWMEERKLCHQSRVWFIRCYIVCCGRGWQGNSGGIEGFIVHWQQGQRRESITKSITFYPYATCVHTWSNKIEHNSSYRAIIKKKSNWWRISKPISKGNFSWNISQSGVLLSMYVCMYVCIRWCSFFKY